MVFDLKIETIEEWVRDRGFSSVAIQLPEGLKVRATEISGRIRSDTGAEVVVLGDPCYGACDLFPDYRSYAQGLVHFGHSRMPSLPADPDVLFVEARSDVRVGPLVADLAQRLPERVGLLASVQYVHLLGEAREALEAAGKTVLVGAGDDRIMYPGQVLGCDFSCGSSVEGDVDCFLFIGEGDFHPLAAAFGVKKEVVVLNPVTGEARSVDDVRDRILRKRFAQIESARGAKSFMVIVSTKPGQRRPEAAARVERMLREDGREVHRLVASEITPQALLPYRVDAFVNTACPRVALDDSARYGKPMLTVPEAEIVAGRRTWDEYVFDTFRRARVINYIRRFDGRHMLTSEILSGADLCDVKIGIGCAKGSEYVESSVRAVDSPNVTVYRDSGRLADDLASGAIDAAVRGDLPSSELLPLVREALGLDRLERAVLLDIDGRAVFVVPVGIDEGYSVEEKVDMADRVSKLWKALGAGEPRIAVMSGGRREDKGRSEAVDATMDSAEAVVRELEARGRDVYDAQILIEDAIDEADVIVAPDGISGNLIFRTLHFIGGVPTLGAPVMNSEDRLFVDTSRRKNDYTDAIYLSAKLAGMGRRPARSRSTARMRA